VAGKKNDNGVRVVIMNRALSLYTAASTILKGHVQLQVPEANLQLFARVFLKRGDVKVSLDDQGGARERGLYLGQVKQTSFRRVRCIVKPSSIAFAASWMLHFVRLAIGTFQEDKGRVLLVPTNYADLSITTTFHFENEPRSPLNVSGTDESNEYVLRAGESSGPVIWQSSDFQSLALPMCLVSQRSDVKVVSRYLRYVLGYHPRYFLPFSRRPSFPALHSLAIGVPQPSSNAIC